MKFKIIVIGLNIVLIAVLLSIFILPFLFDSIDAKAFFLRYWFFPPLFLLLLVGVNWVYIRNGSIITHAEDGDWVALCHTLENEVFDKHHTRYKNLKLLSDVQLLLSDFSGLSRLETFVRSHCHEHLPKLATRFAGGKLLSGQYQELNRFTSNLIKSGKSEDIWLLFYEPFSLQMLKDYEGAANGFKALLAREKEPLVSGLSAYFYYEVLKKRSKENAADLTAQGKAFCAKLKEKYTKSSWKDYTTKKKQEMHILVFKKVIDDATEWLFLS